MTTLAILAAGMAGMLAGWVVCALFSAQDRDTQAPNEDQDELEALDPRTRAWRDDP